MLFPEEDAPMLKAWIVKRIENTLVALVALESPFEAQRSMPLLTRVPIGPTQMLMSLPNMLLPYLSMMATATRCGSFASKRFPTFYQKVRMHPE